MASNTGRKRRISILGSTGSIGVNTCNVVRELPDRLEIAALSSHQTHHRGQLSVLMRQAGIAPPGPYGPAKEEWSNYNAPPPEV